MRRLMLMGLLALGSMCYGCCGAEDLDIDFQTEKETEFFACISMSMPKTALKEISKHLERIGGSFVLRGLPGGSFNEFILMVQELRSMDINANIQIDPDLFEECNVEEVPTFIYFPPSKASEASSAEMLSRAFDDTSYPKYKKIVGNVSVPWALREMEFYE